ncbi:hypothetical protein V8C26DRAFT_310314 [Trichoderma gracile]
MTIYLMHAFIIQGCSATLADVLDWSIRRNQRPSVNLYVSNKETVLGHALQLQSIRSVTGHQAVARRAGRIRTCSTEPGAAQPTLVWSPGERMSHEQPRTDTGLACILGKARHFRVGSMLLRYKRHEPVDEELCRQTCLIVGEQHIHDPTASTISYCSTCAKAAEYSALLSLQRSHLGMHASKTP